MSSCRQLPYFLRQWFTNTLLTLLNKNCSAVMKLDLGDKISLTAQGMSVLSIDHLNWLLYNKMNTS